MTSPTLQPRLLAVDRLLSAFVRRPLENDPRASYALPRNRTFEYIAANFKDLAGRLGA